MCCNGTHPTFLDFYAAVRRYIGWKGLFLSVIAELEGDAEIVAAEHADDILELVL